MKISALLIPIAAVGLVSSPVMAAENQVIREAAIPFANLGGVDDWRADGDRAVYFEDLHHNWYRAELFMPAFDLPYTEYIGIDSRPNGTLDKFGAIYVHGQRYPFESFVKVDGPPSGHHWNRREDR